MPRPSASPSPRSWTDRIPPRFDVLLAWASVAVVHVSAVRTWFAEDDVTYLARAIGLAPIPWSVSRVLFEGLAFPTMHALFGLDPFLYHVANLGLHAINTALVWRIARWLDVGRGAALAAAIVFAASSIAFTPLHWATGIHELLVSMLALAAVALYLLGRKRGSTPLLWVGATLGLGAMLTKENAVFLPLVLWVIEARCRPARGRSGPRSALGGSRGTTRSALAPQTLLATGFVAAYVATVQRVPVMAAAAYARDFRPAFLVTNFATYLAWCGRPLDPMRDAVAAAHPELLWAGAVALLIVVALLWTQRRSAAHPEEVGAAALLLFLVPVVPLRSHTYLYYLYLPWAGASWLIAAAGARLSRTWSHRHAVVAVLLVGLVALEFRNVRLRERTRVHGLLRDRTMRESELLRAAIHDLDAARLPAGSQVAIVDPTPPSYLSVADADTQLRASPRYRGAYRPLEGALRHGEALAVFVPGATLLGVDRSLPRAWEDAQIFWSKANGGLEPLGTGSLALAQLGEMNVSLGQWDEARRLYSRTRERGDTLAPSTLGLMVVEAATGHQDEAQRYAVEFLRRWPDDPRAAVVDSALRSRGSLRLRD